MSGDPEVWRTALAGDVRALRKCFARGDDVNIRGGENRSTPLMAASRIGSVPAIRLVLAHGGDVHLQNKTNKWTALHYSTGWNDQPDVCDLLVTRGAGVNMVDIFGYTPLMWAARENHAEAARVLLERGTDTRITEDRGYSAMQRATVLLSMKTRSLLTDPKILKWSNRGLTNNSLQKKLIKMKKTISYSMLLLADNHLETLPNLNQYNCFKDLQVLNLANNNLKEISEDHIPVNIEKVYFEENPLEVYPDFKHHLKIRSKTCNVQLIEEIAMNKQIDYTGGVLDCSYCDFTTQELETQFQSLIDANLYFKLNLSHNKMQAIPDLGASPSFNHLAVLDVSHNQLQEIPDLASTHSFNHLAVLDVSNNKIMTIRETHIPDKTSTLDAQNNAIEILSLKKKPKLPRYYNLQENQILTVESLPSSNITLNLRQNPVKYLLKGSMSSETTYDTISNALSASQVNNLHQPPPQVFRLGYKGVKSYYIDLENMQEAENSTKRLVFSGPSTAGKTSVVRSLLKGSGSLTNICDRTQVLEIKTWNITDNDCYQIFDQGGHPIYQITCPFFISNEAITFITHNICFPDHMLEQTLQDFQRTIQQHPTNEIHFLVTHVDELEKTNLGPKLADFQESVKSLLHREIDTLSRLKSNAQGSDAEHIEKVLECYQFKKDNCKYFPVSSLTYTGLSDLVIFLKERAAEKRVTLPKQWLKYYQKICKYGGNFMKLDQFHRLYKETYGAMKNLVTTRKNQKEASLNALRYFRDCGLLFWYEENTELREYIFHNVEFVIDLFKSVFHHSLQESLDYSNNADLQGVYTKLEYSRVIQSYEQEGILSYQMLVYLWKKYHLSECDTNALLELLRSFGICYDIFHSENHATLYFPWFNQDKKVPNGFDPYNPMVVNGEVFSLHVECIFFNSIPANVTESLVVKLQKLAVVNNYLGDRYAWSDGLKVTVGKMEIFVYRLKKKLSLNICVRGKTHHCIEIWSNCEKLYLGLVSILDKLKGAVGSLHFQCSHCKNNNIDHPHKWLPSQVFPELQGDLPLEITCPSEPMEDIPTGLVTIIRKGDKNHQRLETDVIQYLKKKSSRDDVPSQLEGKSEKSMKQEMCRKIEEILHPQPLIRELFATNMLSSDDIYQLDSMVITKKCKFLLEKFVHPDEIADKFVAALHTTRFHTNITVGRMLGSVIDTEYNHELITSAEMDQMKRTCYKALQDQMSPDDVSDHLYMDSTIDEYHRGEMSKNNATTTQKVTYLLHYVLFRGTYETVARFRAALIRCKQNHLAELLPRREKESEKTDQCVTEIPPDMNKNPSQKDGSHQEKGDDTQSTVPELYDILEKILHPEPLITELYAVGVLHDDDKHQLRSRVVTKQCQYLLDKLVVDGGSELRDQLVAALHRTQYHTNITAARILDQHTTSTEWNKELISKTEMDTMKLNCYKALQDNMTPEDLMDHLYVDGTIDGHHRAELVGRNTTIQKATYLLDSILFRGTFQTISRFRAALIQCHRPDLARLLPSRSTDVEIASEEEKQTSVDVSDATLQQRETDGSEGAVLVYPR